MMISRSRRRSFDGNDAGGRDEGEEKEGREEAVDDDDAIYQGFKNYAGFRN